MRWGCLVATATMAFAVTVEAAWAQRASENVVNSAEDAFGVSVGNESIGLYSSNSARGFNPGQAGNIRLNGLYFDQQQQIQGRIFDSTAMRVGLSMQSYPFPAPTGIVDIKLHNPADHFSGSASLSAGPYEILQFDAEMEGPLVADKLNGYMTVGAGRFELDNQTDYSQFLLGGLLNWTPSDTTDVVVFDMGFYRNSAIPTSVSTAGGVVPPQFDRGVYFGQPWAGRERVVNHGGILATTRVFDDWLLRIGAFRSASELNKDYVILYRNVLPDGVGDLEILSSPGDLDRSYSGEARLTRSFIEGERQHTFHFALRARSVKHKFGGGSYVPFGRAQIGVYREVPQRPFPPAVASIDRISQVTPALSYVGRWRDVGELSVGLQKTFYRRDVTRPGSLPGHTDAEPWLYNGTLAIYLNKDAVLYGSYTRGLEESGLAPEIATNRGEAMPASLTEQVDAGIRYRLASRITLNAGVFEVKKPYFDRDVANLFTDIGNLSHRGVELSVSGQVAPGLTVIAGAMFLRARIAANVAAASFVGSVPAGRPNKNLRLNVQYAPPAWKGFSIDGQINNDGSAYANRANTLTLASYTTADLGVRYSFKAFGTQASLRARVQNVTDTYAWTVSSSGIYTPIPMRRFTGQVVTDF